MIRAITLAHAQAYGLRCACVHYGLYCPSPMHNYENASSSGHARDLGKRCVGLTHTTGEIQKAWIQIFVHSCAFTGFCRLCKERFCDWRQNKTDSLSTVLGREKHVFEQKFHLLFCTNSFTTNFANEQGVCFEKGAKGKHKENINLRKRSRFDRNVAKKYLYQPDDHQHFAVSKRHEAAGQS